VERQCSERFGRQNSAIATRRSCRPTAARAPSRSAPLSRAVVPAIRPRAKVNAPRTHATERPHSAGRGGLDWTAGRSDSATDPIL